VHRKIATSDDDNAMTSSETATILSPPDMRRAGRPILTTPTISPRLHVESKAPPSLCPSHSSCYCEHQQLLKNVLACTRPVNKNPFRSKKDILADIEMHDGEPQARGPENLSRASG
jgi:hypothetical protein